MSTTEERKDASKEAAEDAFKERLSAFERNGISFDKVAEEIRKIAFNSKIGINNPRLNVKLDALKYLGDRIGMDKTQKHEHSGPNGAPLLPAPALLFDFGGKNAG